MNHRTDMDLACWKCDGKVFLDRHEHARLINGAVIECAGGGLHEPIPTD